jgi:lipoprotein-releasing system permease protein
MSALRYVLRELTYRRSRSVVAVLSFAVAVLAAVLLTALAASYARAVRAPIERVGADVIVQITGDIPPKLEGLVFPHPNALVPADAVAVVRAMDGVISITRAVYMWELAPDHYQSVLGIDDSEAGLRSISSRIIDGKMIGAGDRAVLLDSDFAAKQGLKVGAAIGVGETKFPVIGIVDAARGGKVVRADVYMPLAPAQALAATAPMVQALYPFGRDDTNLLLIKVDRQHLEAVVGKIVALLGKKGIVASELSFREALSGVLFLSQRMGLIVAVVIGAFATAFVLRATASTIQERRRELAVLQAIGWSWRHIRRQVLIENGLLAIIGVAFGILAALVIASLLGHISVTLDLPWDLSSTPHFIPEATLDRTQTVSVPITISWQAVAIAAAGSLFVGLAAAFLLLRSPPPHPWSLLRTE